VTLVGFDPASKEHGLHGLRYLRTGNRYHPATYDESVLDGKVYVDTAAGRERARALREGSRTSPCRSTTAGSSARRRSGSGSASTASSWSAHRVAARSRPSTILVDRGALGAADVVVVPLADRGDRYPDGPLWGDRL
jgi:cysteine synthase B